MFLYCFNRFDNIGYSGNQTVTRATEEDYEQLQMNQSPPKVSSTYAKIYKHMYRFV